MSNDYIKDQLKHLISTEKKGNAVIREAKRMAMIRFGTKLSQNVLETSEEDAERRTERGNESKG